MTALLACCAFWLVLLSLWFLALRSPTGLYTAALAAALFVEVQARVRELGG